jgi:hypothetical protein
MDLKFSDLLTAIAEKKDLSDDIAARVKSVLKEFTDAFKVSVKA